MNLGPTIRTTGTAYEVAKAHEMAAALNSDEVDDWTYVVDYVEGNRFARIKVYDEDGGYLADFGS